MEVSYFLFLRSSAVAQLKWRIKTGYTLNRNNLRFRIDAELVTRTLRNNYVTLRKIYDFFVCLGKDVFIEFSSRTKCHASRKSHCFPFDDRSITSAHSRSISQMY